MIRTALSFVLALIVASPAIAQSRSIHPTGPATGGQVRTPLSQATTPGDSSTIFRITTPGSYYLTENLAVPVGMTGIEIAWPSVTIDLNGFTIVGALNDRGTIAIQPPAPTDDTRSTIEDFHIHNGKINNFQTAILGDRRGVGSVRLSNMRINNVDISNAKDGIIDGERYHIVDCSIDAEHNGIKVYDSHVEDVSIHLASKGGGAGISGSGTIVKDCRVVPVDLGSGRPMTGISMVGGMISGCHVELANADPIGIEATNGTLITGCTVLHESITSGIGIDAESAHVSNCIVYKTATPYMSSGTGYFRGNSAINAGAASIGASTSIDNNF